MRYKVGDTVRWQAVLDRGSYRTEIPMRGVIVSLQETVMGAKQKKATAKLKLDPHWCAHYIHETGRRYTTVSLDKLREEQ